MSESIHTPTATAGVYRLNVGKSFYIGSSSDLKARGSKHHLSLRKGIHPNTRLQQAFNDTQSFEMVVIKDVPRKDDDSDSDHKQRLLLNEQWSLDELYFDIHCCNTSTNSGFNSSIGELTRERWEDPEYRARMTKIAKERPRTDQERANMAASKTGAKNPKAKSCTLHFNGKKLKFPTGIAAATHFNVTQQAMDNWLRGATPWPGAGSRPPREQNRRLIGLCGKYD